MTLLNEQLFLKMLSDGQLLFDTKEAIKTEREATSLVIKYFREIESRQLYLKHGCGSLFEFATGVLGYCAGSAQNRINAMKLVIAVPDAEKKIETGELSLTAASKVQSFFKAEQKAKKSYTAEEKLKVVELCFSKTTREVERELASLNPDFANYETTKPVSKDRLEIKFTITEILDAKFRKLKGLLAHSQPNITTEDILETLVELGLEKFDPLRKAERSIARKFAKHKSSNGNAKTKAHSGDSAPVYDSFHAHETDFHAEAEAETGTETATVTTNQTSRARYIPAHARNQVWIRNAGRGCEYKSSSGATCGSQHALQIDHVLGYARGGAHEPENLRILCGAHNRFVWKSNRTQVVRETVIAYLAG